MALLRCSCGVEIRISLGRMMVLGENGLACPDCGQRLGTEPAQPLRDDEPWPADEPSVEFAEYCEEDVRTGPMESESIEAEPPTGDRVVATLDRLRAYTPDYSSAREYHSQTQAGPLRKAVSDAAMFLFQAPRLDPPPLTFLFARQVYYPFNAFIPFQPPSNFRTAFRDNLRTGLKGSQAEMAILQKALDLFEATDLEPEYAKETSPRWKAWYDLNYGRLVANSVRHIEYQLTCEFLLQADNLNAETNHVRFVPSLVYKGGRVSSGRAVFAQRLLERCRENNRGTPWDMLAEWELNQELGLDVRQIVIQPPKPVQGGSITPTPPTRPISFPKL